jgi:hypothetical protein
MSQKLRKDTTILFLHFFILTLSNYPIATSTPGGCHVPLRTCGCGKYIRITTLNEPGGCRGGDQGSHQCCSLVRCIGLGHSGLMGYQKTRTSYYT